MTQKMRQKLRSSYISILLSNRRKLNSKKGSVVPRVSTCSFELKKKIKYTELAWNEKNLTEDQKTMN